MIFISNIIFNLFILTIISVTLILFLFINVHSQVDLKSRLIYELLFLKMVFKTKHSFRGIVYFYCYKVTYYSTLKFSILYFMFYVLLNSLFLTVSAEEVSSLLTGKEETSQDKSLVSFFRPYLVLLYGISSCFLYFLITAFFDFGSLFGGPEIIIEITPPESVTSVTPPPVLHVSPPPVSAPPVSTPPVPPAQTLNNINYALIDYFENHPARFTLQHLYYDLTNELLPHISLSDVSSRQQFLDYLYRNDTFRSHLFDPKVASGDVFYSHGSAICSYIMEVSKDPHTFEINAFQLEIYKRIATSFSVCSGALQNGTLELMHRPLYYQHIYTQMFPPIL